MIVLGHPHLLDCSTHIHYKKPSLIWQAPSYVAESATLLAISYKSVYFAVNVCLVVVSSQSSGCQANVAILTCR